MTPMVVYKVVERSPFGEFVSPFVNDILGLRLKYEIGVVTYPNVGPIYAYETLESAFQMSNSPSLFMSGVVLECEAGIYDNQKLGKINSLLHWRDYETIQRFWEGDFDSGNVTIVNAVLCKWVKPIKIW